MVGRVVIALLTASVIALYFSRGKIMSALQRLPNEFPSIGRAGIELIKRFEGFSPTVYLDIAGHQTIGYGHKLKSFEQFTGAISEREAEEILKRDVAEAVAAVKRNVRVPLTQNQFDALTSWFYNLGEGEPTITSKLLGFLNGGYYAAAAEQFPVWNKARIGGVLKPIAGLTKRRIAEKELFLT